MSKDELWQHIIERNAKAATEGLNLTATGLRKMFDVIWDVAEKAGRERAERHRSTLDDLFKRFVP